MKILRFAWHDFRNLPGGEIRPGEGVNVICGQNAQGKTNLLEGMWLFTGERSFRRAKDAELVRRDCESAALSLAFYADGREQSAKITIAGGRRAAELNGIKKRSCSALIGEFRAVFAGASGPFERGSGGPPEFYRRSALPDKAVVCGAGAGVQPCACTAQRFTERHPPLRGFA